MISCKQATELISKRADSPLGAWERLQLGLHLSICKFCRSFAKSVEIMRGALRAIAHAPTEAATSENLQEFKARVKESIRKCIEKN